MKFLRLLPLTLMVLPILATALTLSEIPAKVHSANIDVSIARNEVLIAESERRSAAHRLIPDISLHATYVHFPDEISLKIPEHTIQTGIGSITIDPPALTVHPRDWTGSRLQFVQPLYAGGRIFAGIKAAEGKMSESESVQKLTASEKVNEALQRYMQHQLAAEVHAVLVDINDNLSRLVTVAESLVRHGAAAKLAALQIRVARSEAGSKLTEAEGKKTLADLAFRDSIGVSESVSYETPLKKVVNPFLSSEVLKIAAKQRREEFKIINAKQTQVSALKEASIGAAFPTLFAFGATEVGATSRLVLEPKWFVGVGLQVPLSGWVEGIEGKRKAELLENKLSLIARKASSEIPLQIEKLFSEVATLDAQYSAVLDTVTMAQEALRIAEVRFKTGDQSSVELLRSQAELERVLIQKLQIADSFNRKLLELYAATNDIDGFLAQYEKSK